MSSTFRDAIIYNAATYYTPMIWRFTNSFFF
nr:MAG TPA: Mitochondrial import receptor subunit TOM40 protein, mitochondrial protein import [Caudoviricetes sp.]